MPSEAAGRLLAAESRPAAGGDGDPARRALTAALTEAWRRLREEHLAGLPGRALAAARARAVDRALVTAAAEYVGHPNRWALVALGGYGRQELCPHSDVDVLLLCSREEPALHDLAHRIFYGLWDAGLETGHAVRTSAAVFRDLRAGLDDWRRLASGTALLDSRPVAGDREFWRQTLDNLLRRLRKDGGSEFVGALIKSDTSRHSQPAHLAHLLEPHLRDGEGGLRDLHSLRWAAHVLFALHSLDELATAGHLDPVAAAEMTAAADFLTQLRTHLHYTAGRRTDQLFRDYQEEAAAFFQQPVEEFLRQLHRHLEAVRRGSAAFWELVEEGRAGRGRTAAQERVALPRDAAPDPAAALHLFADAARRKAVPSERTIAAARARLQAAEPARWTPEMVTDFVTLLAAGERALPFLEVLDRAGLLEPLLPGWEGIRLLDKRDPYHRWTVDRHAMVTVAELGRLDGFGAALLREAGEAAGLRLAALLHDIGKSGGRGHAEAGAQQAARIAEFMGLPPPLAEEITFLVRHHTLLSRTALGRDLEDEEFVLRLAETVGAPRRLDLLYLLTEADARATGPAGWTPWKAALVRELYHKVRRLLTRGEYAGEDLHARLEAVRAAVRTLAGPRREAADKLLEEMPLSYLLSSRPEIIVAHLELTEGTGPVRLQVRPSSRRGHERLTVMTADRPGLLWRICGTLALHGLNILEARAYTRDDGFALDLFEVCDAVEEAIAPAKWDRLREDLPRAVEGRLALAARLLPKPLPYGAGASGGRSHINFPPAVRVDNEASDFYTIVEVIAPDRVGLLYLITRALSDLDLDIHLAKVDTQGARALDSFYVRDREGQKITDDVHLREIERTLCYELSRP